ncbi:MAG TPA: Ig-like domain-containing protein, partial [Dehalococcoidales bacterium]|nr:Ig-like domain-containing protein [Dehalococcoidales bacterium]
MKTKRNYLFRYLVPVILAIFLMTTVGSCKSKSGISSIAISPLSANIKEGTTQQFTAIGTYNDGSTADITKQVTWISSDTSIASISNIGLATGVALGSTHITASLSGVISPVVILQVSTKALSSIKLTPTSPDNFAVGAKQQFTATGTYDDGSVADISLQVTWSSS